VSDLDSRKVRFLDAFHNSFEILNLTYGDLHPTLARIKSDRKAIPAALWRCWSFVDTVHRLREMAQGTPGLSQKEKEVRAFLEKTEIAENFRHYMQHLRGELSKVQPNLFPVWGSLAWVDLEVPNVSYMVISGAITGKVSFGGCVFDLKEKCWVSKTCLGADNLSFNFDPIFQACMKFKDFVMPWLVQALPGPVEFKEAPLVTMVLLPHP
jgi:hypothetical protein